MLVPPTSAFRCERHAPRAARSSIARDRVGTRVPRREDERRRSEADRARYVRRTQEWIIGLRQVDADAVAAKHPALADEHGAMFTATFNPAQAEKLFAGTGHSFAEMLALALETAGFEVIEAGNEVELQRHLARRRPDAVLIDLQRSEAEGLQLLTRIRNRQTLCNVPILFLAGSDADDFRHQAMRAGADWFGLRPLGMLDLQNQVAELIRNGRPTIERTPRQKRQQMLEQERASRSVDGHWQ